MNQLIPTHQNDNGNILVSGRDLHDFYINGKKVKSGFRIIQGYDNFYLINAYGDVVVPSYVDKKGSLRNAKVLTPQKTIKGYLRVGLILKDKQVHRSIHRLVAETFISNLLNKPEINHIDGNKENNHVDNLEWVTTKENIIHSYKYGLREGTNAQGERNNMSKLSELDVLFIKNSDLKANELSERFGVSKSAIYKVKKGSRWQHLYS